MGASNCKGNKVQHEEGKEEEQRREENKEPAMSLGVPTPGGLTAKAPVGRSEYGRVKVALPRGKGLLDWIHKSSGKNLASARLPKVSAEELMKHNKQSDCWLVLFGQVYDVTPYLEYHPGGVPELMRAAGTDATGLFNQYHSWVNYDSMLKACIVGRFDGDTTKLPPPGPSTLDDDDAAGGGEGSTRGAEGEMNALAHSTMDSHNISASSPSPYSVLLSCPSHWNARTMRIECVSHCIGETSLRLLVKTMDGRSPLELKWDPLPSSFVPSTSLAVSVDEQARIRLDFSPNADEGIGGQFVAMRCTVRERPTLAYHEARVLRILRHSSLPTKEMESGDDAMEGVKVEEEVEDLSPPRDSILLIVETDATASVRVPVGHHVELRVRKGDHSHVRQESVRVPVGHHVELRVKKLASQVSRPYTPIPLTAAMRRWIGGEEEEISARLSSGRLLAFLIKIYSDGVVTPAIERLKRDDLVHISDPIGSIDFCARPYSSTTVSTPPATVPSPINDWKRRVVCLAGGTGLTPMLGVIRERGWDRCRLVAYNKTEEDTPRGGWMTEGGEDTIADDGRIVHVLSAADDAWSGARGRVARENIGELMGAEVVFVCGPDGFVQAAARLLQESGHPTDLVHIFQG